MKDFTLNVIEIIKSIPYGKVVTYGQIALLANNPYASRQVARILHSFADKEQLPWHRVVNKKGMISLENEAGLIQKSLLVDEGIIFVGNRIELYIYGV